MINMDEFEELLNENKQITVLGRKFGQGTILRKCDPIAFHVEYHTYCAAVEDAIEEELEADRFDEALKLLNGYVADGVEFPDAFFKVTSRFPTIEQEALQLAYDSQ